MLPSGRCLTSDPVSVSPAPLTVRLIPVGRRLLDPAACVDIDDIKTRFPDKYDQHIEDMVNSLQHNKSLQKMLTNHGWSIDTAALLK